MEKPKENLVAVEIAYNAEILISIEEAAELLTIFKNARGIKTDYNGKITELDAPLIAIRYKIITSKEIDDFKVSQLLEVNNE